MRFHPHTTLPPPEIRGGVAGQLTGLVAGLFVLAAGIVLVLESRLGLAPWDVLHQGIARNSVLSFGTASIVVGLAVLVLAWLLGERPGLGTIANAVLVGAFIELLLSIGWVTDLAEQGLGARVVLLGLGILAFGIGSGVYIGAAKGAGPRDSLMLAAARRSGTRFGAARAVIELAALLAGLALGGQIGLGTLAFALLIGPSVELGFWVLRRSPLAHEAPRRTPGQSRATP